jgi:hypothetical protein
LAHPSADSQADAPPIERGGVQSAAGSAKPSVPPASLGRRFEQLEGDDWILRADALAFFARYHVLEAIEPSRAILADEKAHAWIRGRALIAVAALLGGESGDVKKALDEVRPFVGHADAQLRAASAEALDSIPGDAAAVQIETLLADSSADVRLRALAAHARRRRADAWSLVDERTRSLDASSYHWGARALALVGTDAAVERIAKLIETDAAILPVTRGIDGVVDRKLVPVLLLALTRLDPDDARASFVFTALGRHERAQLDASFEAALEDAGRSGDEAVVRTVSRVVTLLGSSPSVGDPLRRVLGRVEDSETIKAGLVALGPRPMEPDRHRALFTSHLDHADAEIRALAIRCLAHCDSVNLFDLLRRRVEDDEAIVVLAALNALLRAPVDHAPRGELVAYLETPLTSEVEVIRDLAFQLLGHSGSEKDFKPAIELLIGRLRGLDEHRRAAAAAALGKIAPSDGIAFVARTQGYLSSWMVLGTFLNDQKNSGFDREYPPELEIDFAKKYQAKYVWVLEGRRKGDEPIEREIAWSEAEVERTDGRLDLPPVLPPPGSLSVAYAVADFEIASSRAAILSIDGDDGFRAWLNDEKIAEQVAEFKSRNACVAEQRDIKVQLEAGVNRLVIKSPNIDYEWWVRVRLTDVDGKPIEVVAP